jgi:sialic acid synthase SpsE
VAAVALGAVVIEKHLTLSREMAGPDHRASLEPAEFAALVRAVRNVEMGLGDGIKKPAPSELPYRDIVRRSLVLTRDVRAGEKIALPDLSLKRPGKGIAGEFRAIVLGMRAVRDLRKDAHLSWEDLKNA